MLAAAAAVQVQAELLAQVAQVLAALEQRLGLVETV
jgi:hypothetical protein